MAREKPALLLAEMCNPAWASVPLVGWRHVYHIARQTRVVLVTHEGNRPEIEEQNPPFSVFYIPYDWTDHLLDWILRRIYRNDYSRASLTLVKIPFTLWFEVRAWWRFRSSMRRREFRVVHRITPVSPVVPSPMATLCRCYRIPFVIGPVNGGLPWPKGYQRAGRDREWLSSLRALYRYLPLGRLTWRNATLILIGSRFTMKDIPASYHGKCRYMPENGVDHALIAQSPPRWEKGPLRMVFVGRLVSLKGPDMVLDAARTFLQARSAQLDFIGDGPLLPDLQNMVSQSGLDGSVRFHGWIADQKVVQEKLSQYHVLVFPSVREFGGGAVVEAMAKGVVPLVLDYGGPGEIVDQTCGYKLPLEGEYRTIRRIEQIIGEILADPKVWLKKSHRARQRIADHYTWESKTLKISKWYSDLEQGETP